MEHTKTKGCLDSLTLKLLAMALMLCDHLWATVLPGVMWLTAVGRIAFPISPFRWRRAFSAPMTGKNTCCGCWSLP